MVPYYSELLDLVYASAIGTAFYMQGQVYYKPLVQMIGVQSALIALASALAYLEFGSMDLLVLAGVLILVRGLLTPTIILREVGERYGQRERTTGFASLLVVDLGFFFTVVFILYHFVIQRLFPSEFELVFALSLLFQGLYLIASRNSTPAQILGYIEEENALVVFGMALIPIPLLIEASVLLDVLALVVNATVVIRERKFHIPLEELRG
jgi:hydrogenase-4 component E